jgi:hypothetical protein
VPINTIEENRVLLFMTVPLSLSHPRFESFDPTPTLPLPLKGREAVKKLILRRASGDIGEVLERYLFVGKC